MLAFVTKHNPSNLRVTSHKLDIFVNIRYLVFWCCLTDDDDEFNFYRATHAKRDFLSALPTVTPPAGFNLDRNNGCDFDIQMHGCLDLF